MHNGTPAPGAAGWNAAEDHERVGSLICSKISIYHPMLSRVR